MDYKFTIQKLIPFKQKNQKYSKWDHEEAEVSRFDKHIN